MRFPTISRALARGQKLALALSMSFIGMADASAADLDYAPRVPMAAPRERVVTGQNPSCRIVPGPRHDLYGDTNSFAPMAVCYSAGILADAASYDYPRREPRPVILSFGDKFVKLFEDILR